MDRKRKNETIKKFYLMEMNSTNYDFMQNGVDNIVRAMYFDTKSNSLFVGGYFQRAGTIQTANGIAKWSNIPNPTTATPIVTTISTTIYSTTTNSSQVTTTSQMPQASIGSSSTTIIAVIITVVVVILVKRKILIKKPYRNNFLKKKRC